MVGISNQQVIIQYGLQQRRDWKYVKDEKADWRYLIINLDNAEVTSNFRLVFLLDKHLGLLCSTCKNDITIANVTPSALQTAI